MWFQWSCKATLLKSHFGMGVQICCIFSEHLFLRTPLEGCFCLFTKIHLQSQNQNFRTNLLNMFKVTKKNTRLTSLYIVLVSLLLTFRIQLVLIWCFAVNFEYLIPFRSWLSLLIEFSLLISSEKGILSFAYIHFQR